MEWNQGMILGYYDKPLIFSLMLATTIHLNLLSQVPAWIVVLTTCRLFLCRFHQICTIHSSFMKKATKHWYVSSKTAANNSTATNDTLR